MSAIAIRPLPAPLPDHESLPPAAVRMVVVHERDAYPCRRCLTDALPGERVTLLSYDPFTGDSPYRQPGPIFVHERDCTVSVPAGKIPEQLTRRRLSVRSFDAEHLMLGGEVIDGDALEARATALLDDPAVAYLHVHNAGPGCFAARVDRADTVER